MFQHNLKWGRKDPDTFVYIFYLILQHTSEDTISITNLL